ncbi:hypothetical protein [Azospirillum brasilense]|uniref:hypothetical protein n=1 Tax=Azospirillum brasilense TaxID=192 RepID=UPI001EDBCDFF|nr:hypothetical protein [Azospirillum brasilense]UKJ74551.1 hypothetical protein H1Q64_18505 [Azospirillum brasilense]
MLMTEEEARTKWCPMARNAGVTNRDTGSTASVNRNGREHYGVENCSCIASGCMAWRRENATDAALAARAAGDRRPDWEIKASIAANPRGFCGAFGKPEA